jgi:hypothetical protein
MAGNGARRDRPRGRRRVIAASFAGQAAIIAVVAAGSAHGTYPSAVSGPAGPASAAPVAAAPVPLPPAPARPAAVPMPAVPLPPGEIGVTVSAAGQGGDIGFPAPEDPPRLVIPAGADAAITVDLAIPPGAQVRGLWLGIAADQWAGPLNVRRVLARTGTPLAPGLHTYVLHWAVPAGTPAGRGNLLVLDVQRAEGADQAPVAELVAG